jgi:Putative MetA-pathway of phenol degradation
LRFVTLALLSAMSASIEGAPAAADTDLQDLCTDRPTKSTLPCTVDMGAWQIESDIVNDTTQVENGARTDVLLVADPTVKWGVTSSSDVELSFTPYEFVWHAAAKTRSDVSGFGDLYLRYKTAILQDNDNGTAISLVPYIKIPTASPGLGDGAWEGGVVAPISFALPLGLTLLTDPEVDVLRNSDGSGYHINASALVNFSRAISSSVSGVVEFWTDEDFDPANAMRQSSIDLALEWAARRELQFDIGLNLGLTRASPDLQEYVGVSYKL